VLVCIVWLHTSIEVMLQQTYCSCASQWVLYLALAVWLNISCGRSWMANNWCPAFLTISHSCYPYCCFPQWLLYLALAVWLDNVLANENGVRKRPWYFLLPSYWGLGGRANFRKRTTMSTNMCASQNRSHVILPKIVLISMHLCCAVLASLLAGRPFDACGNAEAASSSKPCTAASTNTTRNAPTRFERQIGCRRMVHLTR